MSRPSSLATQAWVCRAAVLFFLLAATGSSKEIAARNVEPGTRWIGIGTGPTFSLSDDERSTAQLFSDLTAEYAFNRSWSAYASLETGLGETVSIGATAGGRFRFANLRLPLSPFVEAGLASEQTFWPSLSGMALRTGAGTDFFLTAKIRAGFRLTTDFFFLSGSGDTTRPLGHAQLTVARTWP